MATKKKMLQAAAGGAGGAGLDITDVFSTYLYTGAGASGQTITNGIDLASEDGLIWIKRRDGARDHYLHDTEMPSANNYLVSNLSNLFATTAPVTPNSDGFSIGTTYSDYINATGDPFVSWTWRKAPKFFDIVTYTGNSVAGREIPHNLGSTPGMVIVKKTAGGFGDSWMVNHRSIPSTEVVKLNEDIAAIAISVAWNNTAPTATVFTVGNDTAVNTSGYTYVAYIFAHNDGDGEFGPSGDQDIIKCGSYTGNGSTTGPVIDLGFEPQWLLWKRTDSSANWGLIDNMRGFVSSTSGYDDAVLLPNESGAEALDRKFSPLSTGFQPNYNGSDINASGGTYIYMAIRRGPLAPPEAGTDVFAPVAQNTTSTPLVTTGFPVDLAILTSRSGQNRSVVDRLRGSTESSSKRMFTNDTSAETSSSGGLGFDNNTGYKDSLGGHSDSILWNWKRAPGFFDVVAYTGDNTTGSISHGLGAVPEMYIVKRRNGSDGQGWMVYHKDSIASGAANAQSSYLSLHLADAAQSDTNRFGNVAPTTTTFGVSSASANESGATYIAYLFATLAGISKVGSVTHSGTTNVDCGFSAGSRFVMLKRTDATGDWYIWDSVRGIIAGDDPYLLLNTTAAEVTNTDYIDPLSSGFTITSNFTAGDYIFYAIA